MVDPVLSHNQAKTAWRRISLQVKKVIGRLLVDIKRLAFTRFGEDCRVRVFYIPERVDHRVREIHGSNAWNVERARKKGDEAPRLQLFIIQVLPKRRRCRFINVDYPSAKAMPPSAGQFGNVDDIDVP